MSSKITSIKSETHAISHSISQNHAKVICDTSDDFQESFDVSIVTEDMHKPKVMIETSSVNDK